MRQQACTPWRRKGIRTFCSSIGLIDPTFLRHRATSAGTRLPSRPHQSGNASPPFTETRRAPSDRRQQSRPGPPSTAHSSAAPIICASAPAALDLSEFDIDVSGRGCLSRAGRSGILIAQSSMNGKCRLKPPVIARRRRSPTDRGRRGGFRFENWTNFCEFPIDAIAVRA